MVPKTLIPMNSMSEQRNKVDGIVCEELTFRYSERSNYTVLSQVNLQISKGKVTVLSGSSGCGKSTLFYLMAGIYPQNAGVVDAGKIAIDGKEIGKLFPSERAPIVSMMFQNPDLQFCMDTVKNELVFCLENMRKNPEQMDSLIQKALAFCDIEHLEHRLLHTLSGGEKQKVMLACIVLRRPQWLLLDEPFANIDPLSAKTLIKKLGILHKEYGTSIVAVDHQITQWMPILNEVILLDKKGKVRERGMTAQNLPDYREKFHEAGVAFPGEIYRKKQINSTKAPPVLKFRNLKAGYGEEQLILNDIHADFYKGKIHAITGESGSGKSTIFSILCRILPYEGNICFEGKELKSIRRKKMAHRIGFVFQNPQDQFVAQTVYEEMEISLKQTYQADRLEEKVKEYLQGVGLWRYRKISPYMLSQGQQRRLAVAALLAYDCSVLVCDEPTYAQDLNALRSIMELICSRVKKNGLTFIFSTHDKQLAKDYADIQYHLEKGRLEVYV